MVSSPETENFSLKTRTPATTHKKVVIELLDRKTIRGYLNPIRLAHAEVLELLTPDGEREEIELAKVRAIYFVRDLKEEFEPERKSFLSRPKLDGLWVKLRFQDGQILEGVISNDLLTFLDNGLHLTTPDFNSNTDRVFVPRSALAELTVLGVVGIARRKPAAAAAVAAAQPRLFNE
jgi:hypothetical protein